MTTPTKTTTSPSRLVYGKDDCLFGCIEEQQGTRPFGSVLDAGTGLHSLRWIATLESKGMTDFVAITADTSMQAKVQQEANDLGMSHLGNVLIHNWFAPEVENHKTTTTTTTTTTNPLEGQFFDTILADYLIGAMDAFSPYQQDQIMAKLAKYLKPSGRLYIVGLEPIPSSVSSSTNNNGDNQQHPANIICKVRQVRDACILLAGHACYREYPLSWAMRQVQQCPDLQLLHAQNDNDNHDAKSSTSSPPACFRFPILYRHATIVKQINVARSKLKLIANKHASQALANSLAHVLDELEAQSYAATTTNDNDGRIQLGFDYVVAAERKSSSD